MHPYVHAQRTPEKVAIVMAGGFIRARISGPRFPASSLLQRRCRCDLLRPCSHVDACVYGIASMSRH